MAHNGHDGSSNSNSRAIMKTQIRTRIRRNLQSVNLGGSVYYDINQNGKREPNEPGVPNAIVQMRQCETNDRLGNTRTNADGDFSFEFDDAGCYYIRLDRTAYVFTAKGDGSDVDPSSGKSSQADLEEGDTQFWYAGIIPPDDGSVTGMPTDEPTTSEPTNNPTTGRPTTSPTTGAPTVMPSLSFPPTFSPTISVAPTGCIVQDDVEDNIMSSSPILRASYGMVFSVSTPELDGKNMPANIKKKKEEQRVKISSLSLRVTNPILGEQANTKYQVWYRNGDYRDADADGRASFDTRGQFSEWTLIAEGNSVGYDPEKKTDEEGEGDTELTIADGDNTTDVRTQPLIQDSNFLSGAFPSDNGKYGSIPSTLLKDGGKETLNTNGARIKSYLYRIPTSLFTPVILNKYGDKASFYITVERAMLQFGDADPSEWDAIDVQNAEYDPDNNADMNIRLHVGESVLRQPWNDIAQFYSTRRFLGKVWYEQKTAVPCDMHDSYPSAAPTSWEILPLPADAVGQPIETSFVVSIFLQQDIENARRMNDEVLDAFRPTVLEFLNRAYVMKNCVWGVGLEVAFQKLSLLENVRRNLRYRKLLQGAGVTEEYDPWQNMFGAFPKGGRRRNLQNKLTKQITILQVEMIIKGVAYEDESVCPNNAIPATATTDGANWRETMRNIGMKHVTERNEMLGENLKNAHEYFEEIFAVSADETLLKRDIAAVAADENTEDEEGGSMLGPIIGAVCGVLALCLIAGLFLYRRKKKRQKENRAPPEEVLIPDVEEDGTLGNKTKETKADDDSASQEGDVEQAKPDPESAVPVKRHSVAPKGSEDPLAKAWPHLCIVPQLEDVIMTRGIPRRRSEPNLLTAASSAKDLKRTRSISCLREVWINLNKPAFYGDIDLSGGYYGELLVGTMYPVDDSDLLYLERERHLTGDDPDAPYVPFGRNMGFCFIDDDEVERIESPRAKARGDDYVVEAMGEGREKEETGGGANEEGIEVEEQQIRVVNPLVMQQVEMLEAKWKQLKENYDEDADSDDEADLPDDYDVNARIEQLMGHIDKLEKERKAKLKELKRHEQEEDELARKRMVRAGQGINYNEELNRDFVIRKKKNKKKKKQVVEEESEEESSSEEEEQDGEFDVKWMRLKVPLAAQDPETMKSLVNEGKEIPRGGA